MELCRILICIVHGVKWMGFYDLHTKAEKLEEQSDTTEVDEPYIDSFFFIVQQCVMRHSNKTIFKKCLSNVLSQIFICDFFFNFYTKKKNRRLNTPLISPFSCNVFKEGLREMNFFNLLLIRFLSFVSEAL